MKGAPQLSYVIAHAQNVSSCFARAPLCAGELVQCACAFATRSRLDIMSDGSLRQRVLSTTNLLLDAVDKLENSSNEQESSSNMCGGSSGSVRGNFTDRPLTSTSTVRDNRPSSSSLGTSTPSTNSAGSVHAELSHLFSWNSASRLGKRSKTRNRCQSQALGVSKKKKLKSWTHTYICLASVAHKWIPDASERTSLKLAGLGEKKLSVFAYGTGSELQDDLFREFPKLASGGGFDLLHAPDTGSRELVTIEMPHDGYSVEYLQAVVKSAKNYALDE